MRETHNGIGMQSVNTVPCTGVETHLTQVPGPVQIQQSCTEGNPFTITPRTVEVRYVPAIETAILRAQYSTVQYSTAHTQTHTHTNTNTEYGTLREEHCGNAANRTGTPNRCIVKMNNSPQQTHTHTRTMRAAYL